MRSAIRSVLIAAMAVPLAGPALAACPVPSAAASGDRAAQHLLCLQQDLSATANALAEEARRNAETQRLDDLLRTQRQLLVQTQLPPLPAIR